MDSFLRHWISLTLLLVSVHFVNVGNEDALHTKNEISPILNQNQVSSPDVYELSVDILPQNRSQISAKTFRRAKSSLSRKQLRLTALHTSRLHIAYMNAIDSRNLAILNQPHTDYYLHVLNRLRI
jgi:hypothetical protein